MVVGPGAKLERAVLLVKWEVADFDLARRLVDGRREPVDLAVVGDDSVGIVGDFVGPVRAEERRQEGLCEKSYESIIDRTSPGTHPESTRGAISA